MCVHTQATLKLLLMKPSFSVPEVFTSSWKVVKEQIFILVGLLIGFMIISSVLFLVLAPMAGSYTGSIIVWVVSAVFSSLFALGYYKNLFQALDGIEPQFSAYGQQARKILTYFLASFIAGAIIGLGTCLLVLPGIYLYLRLQFYFAFIVEEDAGILDSLKKSWKLTEGMEINLLVLLLVMILIAFLGVLLFGIGIFIATPLVYMMQCYVYRILNSPLNVLDEVAEM